MAKRNYNNHNKPEEFKGEFKSKGEAMDYFAERYAWILWQHLEYLQEQRRKDKEGKGPKHDKTP